MADSLSNAAPVSGLGGMPNRSAHDAVHRRRDGSGDEAPAERQRADEVARHGDVELVARELLRERVLARTRQRLGLPRTGGNVPAFAESVASESTAAFVGRLVGAQNLLAALRAKDLPPDRLRRDLDDAMRAGIVETRDLLAAERPPARTRALPFVDQAEAAYDGLVKLSR